MDVLIWLVILVLVIVVIAAVALSVRRRRGSVRASNLDRKDST